MKLTKTKLLSVSSFLSYLTKKKKKTYNKHLIKIHNIYEIYT